MLIGFSGAVFPDKTIGRANGDRHIQVIERIQSKAFGQRVVDYDFGHCGRGMALLVPGKRKTKELHHSDNSHELRNQQGNHPAMN